MEIGFGWNITDRRVDKNPMFGKISGNAKPIIVRGKEYISATVAAETLGLSPKTISQWERSTKPKDDHCYYI